MTTRQTFDDVFSEPLDFTGDRMVISRKRYDRDEAARLFAAEADCDPDGCVIREGWVRYQIATAYVQAELDSTHAWMLVSEGTPGAQPVWVHE